MARNPKRFTEPQVEHQKLVVWRMREVGKFWHEIAAELSKDSPDGKPISRTTVRERYDAALADHKISRAEWDALRHRQLGQIDAALSKTMQAILDWDGGEVADLAAAARTLITLQERQSKVAGLPEDQTPELEPSAGRAAVYAFITNPAAMGKAARALEQVRAEVIDAELVDDD
mgnify:FL=1